MHLEIRQTKDGSNTLYVPDLNEHYHSVHGALQESQHVFIKHGLEHILEQKRDVKILEIGFGTGLNAILTLPFALAQKAFVQYDTLEKYPLTMDVVEQLHFEQFILNPELLDHFKKMHAAPWNEPIDLSPYFTLQKIHETLEELYELIKPGGTLVTYCAKGAFKRNLKAAGFIVEALPGPPGKREMTRGIRPVL